MSKEDLKGREAELSELKIKYSSFANEQKINFGQYSVKAEEEKLNNPFVEEYALQHNGKLIGCLMHVNYEDLTYDADFVIHPDYRNHGLAQAFTVKAYDDLLENHKELTGAWFIAGGYGGKDVGAHLYDEVFPSQVIQGNTELQNKIGLFLMFGNPGPELLEAGNRGSDLLVKDDEKEYRDEALRLLKESSEQDLGAKFIPENKKKEEVVPISMFNTQTSVAPAPALQQSMELNKRFG